MHLDEKILLADVINAGSFGDIYLGRDVQTGKEYAVKFDKNETPRTQKNFMKEYKIMQEIEGKGGFPKCTISHGATNNLGKTALVMDKLGCNIYELFKICGRRLTMSSVAVLIQEFIKRLEELHNCGIVHRDIKPENFCLGGEDMKDVYLIDFGLSRAYRDDDYTHKPMSKNRGFVGTPRYASKNAHQGITQSRRDDLEAVGYMCIFLMKGSLPWQNVKIKDKKLKHQFLHQKKSNVKLSVLCQDLPQEFKMYLEIVRDLEYDETPQYWRLVEMFKKLESRKNFPSKLCWEEENTFIIAKKKFMKTFPKADYKSLSSHKKRNYDDDRSCALLDDDDISDEPVPNTKMIFIKKTPGMLLVDNNPGNRRFDDKPYVLKNVNRGYAEDEEGFDYSDRRRKKIGKYGY